MSDLVTRLRRWTHAVDAVPASDLMDEAADEIERLRDELSSATRHMEMAEAAWLRETAGNPPVTEPMLKEKRA